MRAVVAEAVPLPVSKALLGRLITGLDGSAAATNVLALIVSHTQTRAVAFEDQARYISIRNISKLGT